MYFRVRMVTLPSTILQPETINTLTNSVYTRNDVENKTRQEWLAWLSTSLISKSYDANDAFVVINEGTSGEIEQILRRSRTATR